MRTLTILLICLSVSVKGQWMHVDSKDDQLERFFTTKLAVPLYGDKDIDNYIKSAFGSIWTITPVEFIKAGSELEYLKNPAYSVFLPYNLLTGMYMSIVVGEKKFREEHPDLIITAPIDVNREKKIEDWIWRLPFMITTIQDQIIWVQDNAIKGLYTTLEEKGMKYINSHALIIKKKTLLIPEEIFNYEYDEKGPTIFVKKLFEDDVMKSYPYEYEILPILDILKLKESEKSSDYVVMVPIFAVHSGNYVYDLKDYTAIAFFEHTGVGPQVEKRELEQLVHIINTAPK